jgi:hypothetical protein
VRTIIVCTATEDGANVSNNYGLLTSGIPSLNAKFVQDAICRISGIPSQMKQCKIISYFMVHFSNCNEFFDPVKWVRVSSVDVEITLRHGFSDCGSRPPGARKLLEGADISRVIGVTHGFCKLASRKI